MNPRDIAILNIKGADYRSIISGINKNEAINLMGKINLTEKRTIIKDKILFSHIKYRQRNLNVWRY